jgi:membrane-associated phospholipid phosphatase
MGPKYALVLLLLSSASAVAQDSSRQNTAQPPAQPGSKHVCTDLSREEIVPCPSEAAPSAGASASPGKDTEKPAEKSNDSRSSSETPAAAQATPAPNHETVTVKRDSKASELRAEAPPDANLHPVPNDYSVSHAAVHDLPLNLLQDQRNFFTSPLRTRASDLDLLVPFAGVTAVLAAGGDRGIESHLPTSPSIISRSKTISDYGAAAMGAGVAGAWLLGQARHDDHMTEAGFLSGEAAVSTLVITELGKYAFGRQRPLVGNGKGDFFSGGDSFPSLHAAAAFSIATVMSEEYPSPFITFLSYGAATGIAATRVTARQHFASDVLVGAGLGWFMGRQVYRAHHNNDGDLKRWGSFERASGDHSGSSSLGSPYVPLDSWVYPAFDRLSALGIIHGGFAGMRPWTRLQCAELLEDASARLEDLSANSSAATTYAALEQEFASELNGSPNAQARIESIYTRVTAISGPVLTDGFHFGQTIINDFGRPYQRGFNSYTGVSSDGVFGPLTFYVRGEYQHAPAGTALPLAARQAIGTADFLSTPPALAVSENNDFTLLDTYVGLNISDWQFSFGKQSLWWGPGDGGPMMFSDNGAPITMIRLNQVKPVKLPSIFGWLGAFRTEGFLGRLSGYQFIYAPSGLVGQWGQSLSDQPFIHGQRISFQPTENFEFGFSRTTVFGGTGYPVTWSSFSRSLVSTGNYSVGASKKPGDRRSGLDFSYRLPKMRNWLTFYGDGFTEDEYSPIAYWDRSDWHAGLYMPRVPGLQRMDLRVEGVYTDNPIGGGYNALEGGYSGGYFYWNATWRNGYTNNGELLGSWIGRNGQGAQGWATYHLSARSSIQIEFRHQKISNQFITGGGTIVDAGVLGEWRVLPDVTVGGLVQYESFKFPVLAPARQSNLLTSIDIKYWPRQLHISR